MWKHWHNKLEKEFKTNPFRSYVENETYQLKVVAPEEKFEHAASFLRFSAPSTLIRHENAAFQKRSSNQRNLTISALMWTENNLNTQLFESDDVTIITWFS